MTRRALTLVLAILMIFPFLELLAERASSASQVHHLAKKKPKRPACHDRKDNDHDGKRDYPRDPGCKSRRDRSEKDPKSKLPGQGGLGTGASLGGRRMFPDDNPWNADISNEPVDSNSDAIIASIGVNTGLHPDFGTVWNGAPIGLPYVVVSGSQAKVSISSWEYGSESDHGPYPIPANPPIEGGSNGTGDRHILIVDRDNWILYELYHAFYSGGHWSAGSGAIFNLSSNEVRPAGWTSADAAGLPILPGLVRYDEVVEQGEIRHALRFTVDQSRRGYIYPARHFASSDTNPNLPPMGMRVRLKAGYDISSYPAHVQVILRAMKKYGMFVADNGSNWFISGSPDSRWDDDELATIHGVQGSAFEVVQMGTIVTD